MQGRIIFNLELELHLPGTMTFWILFEVHLKKEVLGKLRIHLSDHGASGRGQEEQASPPCGTVTHTSPFSQCLKCYRNALEVSLLPAPDGSPLLLFFNLHYVSRYFSLFCSVFYLHPPVFLSLISVARNMPRLSAFVFLIFCVFKNYLFIKNYDKNVSF